MVKCADCSFCVLFVLLGTNRPLPLFCTPFTSLYQFNGAFPLHGTVRLGTVRYGTAQLGSVAFPPQFSTAIEWAGLFTRRYNCAASTAVTSS